MHKVVIGTVFAFSISACGGGTTGPSSYVTTMKTYADASGVLAIAKADSNGNPAKYMLVSTDLATATDVANGTISLTATASSQNGNYYAVAREGASAGGKSLTVTTFGENLNASGSEYASMSVVTINNQPGLLTAGTAASSLPSGTHVYTGAATVVDGIVNAGDGSFTLTANFDANTASLTASTIASLSTNNTAYFFSGSDMEMDQADGSFSTSTGLIGVTGGASESASVKGYFAGTAAKGVHGLAYTNDTATPDLVGGFYGSR